MRAWKIGLLAPEPFIFELEAALGEYFLLPYSCTIPSLWTRIFACNFYVHHVFLSEFFGGQSHEVKTESIPRSTSGSDFTGNGQRHILIHPRRIVLVTVWLFFLMLVKQPFGSVTNWSFFVELQVGKNLMDQEASKVHFRPHLGSNISRVSKRSFFKLNFQPFAGLEFEWTWNTEKNHHSTKWSKKEEKNRTDEVRQQKRRKMFRMNRMLFFPNRFQRGNAPKHLTIITVIISFVFKITLANSTSRNSQSMIVITFRVDTKLGEGTSEQGRSSVTRIESLDFFQIWRAVRLVILFHWGRFRNQTVFFVFLHCFPNPSQVWILATVSTLPRFNTKTHKHDNPGWTRRRWFQFHCTRLFW